MKVDLIKKITAEAKKGPSAKLAQMSRDAYMAGLLTLDEIKAAVLAAKEQK